MIFSETIMKLLFEYKILLRKFLPSRTRSEKLAALGLDIELYGYSDVDLYHKVEMIIKDLESLQTTKSHTVNWYSGTDEFLQHCKKTLANYRIEGNKVIHIAYAASQATLEAIQLLQFQADKLTTNASRLANCCAIINKHGTLEQKQLVMNLLKKHQQPNHSRLNPILNSAVGTLNC